MRHLVNNKPLIISRHFLYFTCFLHRPSYVIRLHLLTPVFSTFLFFILFYFLKFNPAILPGRVPCAIPYWSVHNFHTSLTLLRIPHTWFPLIRSPLRILCDALKLWKPLSCSFLRSALISLFLRFICSPQHPLIKHIPFTSPPPP